MQKYGTGKDGFYSYAQVKNVRFEIPGGEEQFPLRGELTFLESIGDDAPDDRADRLNHPIGYRADIFR